MRRMHDFDYKGRHVAVSLVSAVRLWHWWCEIDGGLPVTIIGRRFDRWGPALEDAMTDARERNDCMTPAKG